MQPNATTPPQHTLAFLKRHAAGWLALVILSAPSIWMLATIPPLWRDVDAYNQVTVAPVKATYLGHGPLYTFIARLPLWLGEQFEIVRSGSLSGLHLHLMQPHLTDSGVFLLLLAQHAGFIAASWLLIATISRRTWVRLALALLWTGTTGFYTLAHCVGSETLSLICTVLVSAAIVRLLQRPRVSRRAWVWYGSALLAALLTRYVNLWLVAILPLTFLLVALGAQFRVWLTRASAALRERRTLLARRAVLAIAISILCVFSADLLARTVCRVNKLRFHSMMGHTFIWRVQFLADMTRENRDDLFDRARRHADTADAVTILNLMQKFLDDGERVSAAKIETQGRDLITNKQTRHARVVLDAALNSMAWAFLWPPAPELIREARSDFLRARQITLTEVAYSLFATSAYYFNHPERMEQSAALTTFRDRTANELVAMPARYPYFGLTRGLTYDRAFVLWLGALVVLAIALRFMRRLRSELLVFLASMTVIGVLTVISTCLLGELLPRYTLPMWELLVLSFFIVLGTGLDLIGRTRRLPKMAPVRSSGRA